jgi:hypothetical protein
MYVQLRHAWPQLSIALFLSCMCCLQPSASCTVLRSIHIAVIVHCRSRMKFRVGQDFRSHRPYPRLLAHQRFPEDPRDLAVNFRIMFSARQPISCTGIALRCFAVMQTCNVIRCRGSLFQQQQSVEKQPHAVDRENHRHSAALMTGETSCHSITKHECLDPALRGVSGLLLLVTFHAVKT